MPIYRPMTDDEIHQIIDAQTRVISLVDETERLCLHHVVWQLIKQVRESDAGRFNPFDPEWVAERDRQIKELELHFSQAKLISDS